MPPEEEARRLLSIGDDLQKVQEDGLVALLQKNAKCDYGRDYGFAEIRDADEYRRRAPLIEYEDLRAAVDRMALGEKGVLTSERVVSFFKTSGSQSRPKLIPVTPSLILEKSRAFGIFWHFIYRDHPVLKGGRWVANFGDYVEKERTEGGIRVLSETSFWNERMQGFQQRHRWPIPPTLRTVADSDLRYYAAARFALQHELHGIMNLNPSTLHVFACTLAEHRDALFDALESGELGYPGEVEADDLERLAPHLIAVPERARELRQAARDAGGEVPWRRLWPGLELIICWQSQGVRPYLRLLEDVCRGIAMRDYITQASETIVAIPTHDGISGGVLAATSHFFEFIPESDAGAAQPATLLAHELTEGGVYEVAVTTGGGLYRYRLGDCLRVTGFEGGVPRLEFLYRTGATSSMTGEKLTEPQVLDAAEAAAKTSGLDPARLFCFPRSEPLPHYGLVLRLSDADAAVGIEERCQRIGAFLRAFEDELQRANSEYESKRGSGRLGAPVAHEVTADELVRLRRRIVAERRISEEQVKLGTLLRHMDLDRELEVLQMVEV